MSPYVTNKMKPTRGHYKPGQNTISGKAYLWEWKNTNGES